MGNICEVCAAPQLESHEIASTKMDDKKILATKAPMSPAAEKESGLVLKEEAETTAESSSPRPYAGESTLGSPNSLISTQSRNTSSKYSGQKSQSSSNRGSDKRKEARQNSLSRESTEGSGNSQEVGSEATSNSEDAWAQYEHIGLNRNSKVFTGLPVSLKFTHKTNYNQRFIWITLSGDRQTINMSEFMSKERRHKEASMSQVLNVTPGIPKKIPNGFRKNANSVGCCLTISFTRGGGIDIKFQNQKERDKWHEYLTKILCK